MTSDDFEVSVKGGGVSIARKVGPDKAQAIIGILLGGAAALPAAAHPAPHSAAGVAQRSTQKAGSGKEKVLAQPQESLSSADLANLLKEHKLFERLQERILLKRDFWAKVAGVMTLLDRPLLPSEVANVLSELGAKAVANNVSTYFGGRKASLITSGQKGGRRYKLTTKAKMEIEKSLNDPEK